MVGKNIEVKNDKTYYTASRLPVDPRPEHYNLTLTPDLKDFTFTGTVEIKFATETQVSEIILNALDLEIQDGFIVNFDGQMSKLNKVIYNNEMETIALGFELDKFAPKSLTLMFDGFLNDKMKGFYRSSFTIGEQNVYAATTQFEATDARRAFPCFDEPAFKATFNVTLIYDSTPIKVGDKSYKQVAISNCDPISESKIDDVKTMVKFETSPKMSTYLLAFVIGPFNFVENKTKNNCRVRVYATPGKEHQGEFALDVACKSLDFYEEYFNIKFPLKKMDLIAIPDFKTGAMENWGLVTYRETALLVDALKTDTARKQFITLVVAHELAHQWFGNLVTMAWWNDLWLNEGFATFVEYLCADHLFPEWDLWSHFVSDVWMSAMVKDSSNNSHPIEVPVNYASEIDEIFDDISYEKGSSVIRMLYDYIGDDMFRIGMKNYLEKFSYNNATTHDLWASLEDASNKPISKMMSAWVFQMGYPWIRVEASTTEGSQDMTINLEQEKFTVNGKLPKGGEAMKWMVPISIISGSPDVSPINEFMEEKHKTFLIPKQGNNWLKINKDTTGFYRTAYPPILLDRFIKTIREDCVSKVSEGDSKGLLSPVDRLGIHNDYFALCRAGHVLTSDLLKLLSSFEDETNYNVWRSIDNSVGWLSIIVQDTEYHDAFYSFARQLYKKIYSRLTWQARESEDYSDPMLRCLVINRLISLEDQGVVDIAKRHFNEQVNQHKPISPDLRTPVYNSISKFGNDSEFEQLFNIRKTDESHEEKNRITRALSCTKDSNRLKRVIESLFSDDVRTQDKMMGVFPIGQSNPKLAWQLYKERHDYYLETFGAGFTLNGFISQSLQYNKSLEIADDIEKFFETRKITGTERAIQQSLETIRSNAEWLARIGKDTNVMTFLSKFLHK